MTLGGMIIETVAQALLDAALRPDSESRVGRSLHLLPELLRRITVRYCDPLVQYQLGKYRIRLPLSAQQPRYRKLYPNYAMQVARIGRIVKFKYPTMRIINVGANVGDTAAILLSAESHQILCIEGDDVYFAVLESNARNLGDGVHPVHCYVGATTGRLAATVSASRGTGRLVPTGAQHESVQIARLSDILADRPEFLESKLLIIDTDGYDCAIIESELPWLSESRPVVFFEYVPDLALSVGIDPSVVFDALRTVGYDGLLVYDNTGDYLCSAHLHNRELLEDLHSYFVGRGNRRYCDICAFHCEDTDLFAQARRAELAYFGAFRSGDTGRQSA